MKMKTGWVECTLGDFKFWVQMGHVRFISKGTTGTYVSFDSEDNYIKVDQEPEHFMDKSYPNEGDPRCQS